MTHNGGHFFSLLFLHFHHIDGMKYSMCWFYGAVALIAFCGLIKDTEGIRVLFLFLMEWAKNWFWQLMPAATWDDILSSRLHIC